MMRIGCMLALYLAIAHSVGWPQTVKPVFVGMELIEAKCTSTVDGSVALSGLRVDLGRLTVNVLDSYSILGRGRSFTGFSLRELASSVRVLAIINGGATASFSTPVPVGLLVTQGRVVSKLASKSKSLSGVLCLDGTTASVVGIASYNPSKCNSAVQAGPIVVEGGRNVIGTPERSALGAYQRSLAALDGSGKLFLMTTSKVHLYELAQCLVKELKKLDIREVLNLDGDTSSGLVIAAPGSTRREIGSTTSLVASAIAVLPPRAAARPSKQR